MVLQKRDVSKSTLDDGERKLLRMASECQRLRAEREQLKADIFELRLRLGDHQRKAAEQGVKRG